MAAECLTQVKQRREAAPHPKLRVAKVELFQREMREEPYEESVYECRDSTSRIMHTTDMSEFPPFWWFTN